MYANNTVQAQNYGYGMNNYGTNMGVNSNPTLYPGQPMNPAPVPMVNQINHGNKGRTSRQCLYLILGILVLLVVLSIVGIMFAALGERGNCLDYIMSSLF